MSFVFVAEATRNELCFCGRVRDEKAQFLWRRPVGLSYVSVVVALCNRLYILAVKAGWNELCFCGGGRVE
jgi:hypothetical protein